MTAAISLVVAFLTLSQSAQAFRQQPTLQTNTRIQEDESEEHIAGEKTPGDNKWKTLSDRVLSGAAGSHMTKHGYIAAENPAEEFPLGVYDITASSQVFPDIVQAGIALSSAVLGNLHDAGIEAVKVLEVEYDEAEARVRARIESPAGWISLLDTRNGFRWATSREKFCEAQMSAPSDWCTLASATEKCDLIEKRDLIEGKCLPKELVLTVKSGMTEEELVFPLGTYDVVEEARVQQGASLDSQVLYRFGDLEIGETVNVLKTEFVPSETRVRAQIEQKSKGLIGWISLLDTSDNFRWAENRAAFCAVQGSWCYYYYHKCYIEEGTGACKPHIYPAKMF